MMNRKFRNIELIEQYCNNQLQGQALTDFEQRLQTDDALMQEVELFFDMMKGIKLQGDEELKKNITATHQELKEADFFEEGATIRSMDERDLRKTGFAGSKKYIPQKSIKTELIKALVEPRKIAIERRFNIRRVLAIAASLSLLIIAGLFLYNANKTSFSDEILANYGEGIAPQEVHVQVEDLKSPAGFIPTTSADPKLVEGLENYANGNYEKTEELLLAFLSESKRSISGFSVKEGEEITIQSIPFNMEHIEIAKHYLGLSYFAMKEYETALTYLEPLTTYTELEQQQQQATWYTALSYLLLDIESDKIFRQWYLEEITRDAASPYKEKAQEILEKIKHR